MTRPIGWMWWFAATAVAVIVWFGLIGPPVAMAESAPIPVGPAEQATGKPVHPQAESGGERTAPLPPGTPSKTGKVRNPYDMEALKRFEAGSHREG